MKVAILIPARFASSRYPGKPLVELRGASGVAKPLIQRSVEAARRVPGVSEVFVTTDDDRIAEACNGLGVGVIMTSPECRNGTERCAEALASLHEPDLVINFQGDALLTPPGFVEALIARMHDDSDALVATPAMRLRSEEVRALQAEEAAGRVGGTSVVTDVQGYALYFSKRLIPYLPKGVLDAPLSPARLHVGVYAYRPAALLRYVATPVSELEQLEGLEQLRFLVAGVPMAVVDVETPPFALRELNNPEDVAAIEQALIDFRSRMSYFDGLPERYRVIFCDIWGVVHDGMNLYAGAADRLLEWRDHGRTVILITNAPRTAEAVENQLQRIGLPREAWDGISTSGEAGIAALKKIGRPVGFIGTRADRVILEGREVPIDDGDDFKEFACTGLDDERHGVEDYRMQLEELARRDVLMHCLNPDRIVVRGGATEPCAGALADVYLGLGGRVEWYGKPFPTIYRHALSLAGDPSATSVLAVGDGLQTDILGAAKMGFDAVFVGGGIHAGEVFPSDFGRQNGLEDWHPVAVVDSLR